MPRRPLLSVSYGGEDLLARCMNDNLVVSKQICLLRMKAIRPMYVLRALSSVPVDSESLVDGLRSRRLSEPRNDGARHHHGYNYGSAYLSSGHFVSSLPSR